MQEKNAEVCLAEGELLKCTSKFKVKDGFQYLESPLKRITAWFMELREKFAVAISKNQEPNPWYDIADH